MTVPVQVLDFDHLVLRVRDAEVALAWYTTKLGLRPHRVDEFRTGAAPFPSVEVRPGTVIDLDPRAPRSGENVSHICLAVEEIDLHALAESGEFEVVGGPFARWGARGVADLLYVSDPDGNIIELRHYGPITASYHGAERPA